MPEDLAKRYEEATDQKARNQIISEYAARMGGDDIAEKEALNLSKDHFERLIEKMGDLSAASAKTAIKEAAGDVERKYNLNGDQAREIAERAFTSGEQKLRNERSDKEMAAKVFRGMFLGKQGNSSAYERSLEEEAAYYKRTYGRDTRAMSLTTDTTGGYLAPTLFSDMLYDNIARTSLVRRFAKIIPMNRNEVINIPTLTGTLTAEQKAEAVSIDGSQPTFGQKQLLTKKISTKSNPISAEMVEKANPAIVDLILRFSMIELTKKEDEVVFGATGEGIRASSTNLVTTGAASSGYGAITFDHMIDLETELDPQYLAGDDIQGSGIIADMPRYWLPHALIQQLKKKKETGTGAYLDEAKELRNSGKIFGYEAKRALSLPDGSSLSSSDKVGIFGNLQHVWCGVEPGFRILIADQGVTDNAGGADVNLFDTDQIAIRVSEWFSSVVVDEEAFSIAQMS